MSDRVALSVIIASHDADDVIDACLHALELQRASVNLEVIVADSSKDLTAERVRDRFGWVRLLHTDEPLTVPALRGRGIAAALVHAALAHARERGLKVRPDCSYAEAYMQRHPETLDLLHD